MTKKLFWFLLGVLLGHHFARRNREIADLDVIARLRACGGM